MTHVKRRLSALSGNRPGRGVLSTIGAAWSIGGRWERLFIMWPVFWVAYTAGMFSWFAWSNQPSLVWIRFFWVAFTAVALLDVWVAPILSAKVLRMLVDTDSGVATENASSLANYLETQHGGRWLRGNLISLAYLVGYSVWGFVAALFFPSLAGRNDEWSFLGVHLGLVLSLLLVYWRFAAGLVRDAVRRGFPLDGVKRTLFLRLFPLR